MVLSAKKEIKTRSKAQSNGRRGLLLTQESGRPPMRQEGQHMHLSRESAF